MSPATNNHTTPAPSPNSPAAPAAHAEIAAAVWSALAQFETQVTMLRSASSALREITSQRTDEAEWDDRAIGIDYLERDELTPNRIMLARRGGDLIRLTDWEGASWDGESIFDGSA